MGCYLPGVQQTLSDIKRLLASQNVFPKKRFGQNFLHDHNQLDKILNAAGVAEGDLVVEVGPGTGALTCRLLHGGSIVIAVEIDNDMAAILTSEFGQHDAFTLIHDDVLAGKHAINPKLIEAVGDRPFKLVANLPYNVASPLMINLIRQCPAMSDMIVMVQKEVADRMAAKHGGKDYGPLSILVQAACSVERIATLPPGCFWPPPKIDSAVIKLTRLDQPLTQDLDALSTMCQKLFQKRRKQLGAILGRDRAWPEGVEPTMRPEGLTVEQVVELAGA